MNKQPRTFRGRVVVQISAFVVAAVGIITPYAVVKTWVQGAPLHPRTIWMCGAASLTLLALGYGLIPELDQEGAISLVDIFDHFNRSQTYEQRAANASDSEN